MYNTYETLLSNLCYRIMKHNPDHHKYSIYYGGAKSYLQEWYYCSICEKCIKIGS